MLHRHLFESGRSQVNRCFSELLGSHAIFSVILSSLGNNRELDLVNTFTCLNPSTIPYVGLLNSGKWSGQIQIVKFGYKTITEEMVPDNYRIQIEVANHMFPKFLCTCGRKQTSSLGIGSIEHWEVVLYLMLYFWLLLLQYLRIRNP